MRWAVAIVLLMARAVSAQPSPELRWGGDAEGGAPFVEADPSDPSRVVGFDVEIARMLAEGSQPLVDRAYHALRAIMGIAPVTKQSGRRRTVSMRYACNARLRNAAYHWARTGAQQEAGSRAYYASLRARGHSHGRALRSVADRLLRILMTLLTRGQIFDPNYGQHVAPLAATGA